YLSKFFGWALDRDMIEASPAALVKKPGKERKRDRTLTDDEIRAIWRGCERVGVFGRAVRFMLATGQRRTEVGQAPSTEIDGAARLWRLPGERTKAGRAHEIPLSDVALGVLDASPQLGRFVFTTRGDRPISGWSKWKASLDAAVLADGATVAQWGLHDLRR